MKLKTWIEISRKALGYNIGVFRRILAARPKLMAVVKSNAYGHGILVFSKLADQLGVDGFCVDSVIEGEKLRRAGIKKPIFVLGFTLPDLFKMAEKNDITITISNKESLASWFRSKCKPNFHIKVDTGMHRQGFYVDELSEIRNWKLEIGNSLRGVYTHFASANDLDNQDYTEIQFAKFNKAVDIFEKAGFNPPSGGLIKHVAATGATLVNSKYHLDWVRVGIGLYGLWPSSKLEKQLSSKIRLSPVLSWKTVVSEIKELKKGDLVGYDGSEVMKNDSWMAVIPIGYWHGMSRALSSLGRVLINGRECKILGRVSMDMVVVEVLPGKVKIGDIVTLIGRDGKKEMQVSKMAECAGMAHYEMITRLNPLIERVLI